MIEGVHSGAMAHGPIGTLVKLRVALLPKQRRRGGGGASMLGHSAAVRVCYRLLLIPGRVRYSGFIYFATPQTAIFLFRFTPTTSGIYSTTSNSTEGPAR